MVGRRTNGPDGARVESIPDAEVLPAEPYLAAAAEVLPELPGVETAITIAILVETYGFDLDDREPLQVAARRKQWMTWSTWAKETGARPVGAGVAGA